MYVIPELLCFAFISIKNPNLVESADTDNTQAVCHAERIGASYNEVSALTGEGLEEMIEATGKLAVERIVGPKIESESPATEERKRARLKKRRLFKKLG